MPEFILYVATTLDGYIARADGSIDWLTAFETDGEDYGYTAFYDSIDALVMGSTTYEQVVGFGDWSYPGKRSYVLTHRQLVSDRDDVMFVQGDIEAVLEDSQRQGYQRLWIVGGGKIASLFIARDLVDEYILTIMPIILGTGISLYQAVPEQQLKLVKTIPYASGAVELRYKRRG